MIAPCGVGCKRLFGVVAPLGGTPGGTKERVPLPPTRLDGLCPRYGRSSRPTTR